LIFLKYQISGVEAATFCFTNNLLKISSPSIEIVAPFNLEKSITVLKKKKRNSITDTHLYKLKHFERLTDVIFMLNIFLQMENGSGAVVPSNSSDRSDRSDKPLDQKVISWFLFLKFLFNLVLLVINCIFEFFIS
jgi:hypothetical protein